jgi:hypothetical protein
MPRKRAVCLDRPERCATLNGAGKTSTQQADGAFNGGHSRRARLKKVSASDGPA